MRLSLKEFFDRIEDHRLVENFSRDMSVDEMAQEWMNLASREFGAIIEGDIRGFIIRATENLSNHFGLIK